jgi:hypothetical protein
MLAIAGAMVNQLE